MMLTEVVDKIEKLVAEGMTPSVVPVDKNSSAVAYVWSPKEGKFQMIDLTRPDRRHQVTTLDSLAGAFERYSAGVEPSVWVALTSIVVTLDDHDEGHRFDRITLPVVPSPLFDLLQRLPDEQKPLIDAIRHDLRPSKIIPETFELAIANLRWETTDTAEGTYGTVKSTMGRQVNAEVKSGSDIPPEISVTFQPFPALADDLDCDVTVECSVVVDASEREIKVRPFPGQIDMAKAKAVEALRAKVTELLKADHKQVFSGTP